MAKKKRPVRKKSLDKIADPPVGVPPPAVAQPPQELPSERHSFAQLKGPTDFHEYKKGSRFRGDP